METHDYLDIALDKCKDGDRLTCTTLYKSSTHAEAFTVGWTYAVIKVGYKLVIRDDNGRSETDSVSTFKKVSPSSTVTTQRTSMEGTHPKIITVEGWSGQVVKKIEEKLRQGYVLHGDMMHNTGSISTDFAVCQVMVEKEFYYKHFVKSRGDIL